MTRFRAHDVEFDAPLGWEDWSLVDVSAPDENGDGTSTRFVVSRAPKTENVTLSEFVDTYLYDLLTRLTSFALETEETILFQGRAGVQCLFSWTPDHCDGPVAQRLTFVDDGSKILLFSESWETRTDEGATAALNTILESVQIRTPESFGADALAEPAPPPLVPPRREPPAAVPPQGWGPAAPGSRDPGSSSR